MDNATLRRFVYGILITVTASIMTARIIGVERVFEPSVPNPAVWPKDRPEPFPTFSSNDRSRWAAVRALVENRTFVVGRRVKDPSADVGWRNIDGVRTKDPNAKKGYYDEGIAFQEGYKSVDYVKHPQTDEFYSTKPPLFTFIVAGEYWLLNKALGWSLKDSRDRWPIVCTILITFNVIPFVIVLVLLANLLEEYGRSDWGRLFVFACACFGSFLTTFAVTLNNHTPAACCAMLAIYPLLSGRSNEWSKPLTAPQALVSGFFAGLAACFDLPAAILPALIGLVILFRGGRGLIWFILAAAIPIGALLYVNHATFDTAVPVYSKKESEWYKYEGSHWSKTEGKGIDFAREDKEVYALHMTVGHHGLFSLSPIWLLAMLGMIGGMGAAVGARRALSVIAFLATAVVIGFYIWKTNNYEGWTSGPRWQFWLIPLFLLAMLPIADGLGEARGGRTIAYLFLAVSVFSAVYPVFNPWRHPWIYNLCEYMGWLKY
jgi:phage shock protein PspC (stress-responsive transcriptional regulator)